MTLDRPRLSCYTCIVNNRLSDLSIPSTTTQLLTAEQELHLIKLYSEGEQAAEFALNKLVTHNLGLVHKICHRFPIKNASCTYDDLFQEGVAGLIHAIGKYDIKRGYRLSTYAYRWIQAYVSRYYQNHGKTIRIPVHLSTKEMTHRKDVEQLTRDLGHTPTQSELASYGIAVKDLPQVTSLNKLVSENEELECFAGDDDTDTKDAAMDVDMLLSRLRDDVSPRDFNMFVYRHGLMGKGEHTLSEISEYHGVTRARVHQIMNRMMGQMRAYVA